MTPPGEDITIGELARLISAMERRFNDEFASVHRRLDSLQFVHRETYTVQMGALIDRVEALEDAKKWTARTFVAAFMFPVLVAVMVALVVSRA